jgi:hypothetical protein
MCDKKKDIKDCTETAILCNLYICNDCLNENS